MVEIFLIAVSLALDAFAVSVSSGISIPGFGVKQAARMGLWFGAFQFMMPVAGWLLGSSVSQYIETVDHWVAFGLLADLGGGSTELVSYRNRAIQSACSLSVGSLSLFSKYVSKLHPTKEERRAIRRAVEEQLEQFVPQHPPARHICGVGGTVRAACKVANAMFDRPAGDRSLDRDELKEMLQRLKKPGRDELRLLLKTVPDRIHTIIPGLLALDTIAKAYGAQTITASACGVREGYLLARVLGEPLEDQSKITPST